MDIDFKKIIAWLKRNKIDYTIIEDNRIVLFDDSNGKVVLVFNQDRITPKAPRGVLMPSSAADGSEFYVKVGDWGKWLKEFLAWAKDRGYYEYNHYRNSQWGTWKFGNFISMSFFGAFIKKIIALKNGVNESMKLDEAKQILNKNGFLVEKFDTEDKYVFKETDEGWFAEFLKRYDAYGDFGSGIEERVESYSDGILTFENTRGYLDEDNTAEFSWFVDAHELFADADDVKAFMASYKAKQSKSSRKKGKNLTAAEIAKLIRDSGISIDAVINALNNGED